MMMLGRMGLLDGNFATSASSSYSHCVQALLLFMIIYVLQIISL